MDYDGWVFFFRFFFFLILFVQILNGWPTITFSGKFGGQGFRGFEEYLLTKGTLLMKVFVFQILLFKKDLFYDKNFLEVSVCMERSQIPSNPWNSSNANFSKIHSIVRLEQFQRLFLLFNFWKLLLVFLCIKCRIWEI